MTRSEPQPLSNYTITELAEESFIDALAESTDVAFVGDVAKRCGEAWSVLQSVTIIAAYRMKQLFESTSSRKAAEAATGYPSWTAWLDDGDWPVSPSLIRTRVLNVTDYARQGLSWAQIHAVLAASPTAGNDVLEKVVDSKGNLLPHIDPADLPGGSVEGLLTAIAALPPGQARKLVSEVAGEPQVYITSLVLSNGMMLGAIVEEGESGNLYLNFQVTCRTDDGLQVPMDERTAKWFARKFGKRVVV